MNMVEVFKTDVYGVRRAKILLAKLVINFPACRINFDLDDCDKVLRVEGDDFCKHRIIDLLNLNGYHCEELV